MHTHSAVSCEPDVISATFIVDILEALPLLAGRGGWIWLLVGGAAIPSSFLWDRVATAFGQMPALLLAYALHTVSIILPFLADSPALNLLGAALWGRPLSALSACPCRSPAAAIRRTRPGRWRA